MPGSSICGRRRRADASADSADMAAQFPGTEPLMVDRRAAAISMRHPSSTPTPRPCLRAGYLANAATANPDTLAVNLSSDRVRVALGLIEGIRNGQSLGALLGYRFERGPARCVHARRSRQVHLPAAQGLSAGCRCAGLDQDRSQHADRGDRGAQRPRWQEAGGSDARTSGIATYPLGCTAACPRQRRRAARARRADDALLDAYDAIADLALAEGVYPGGAGELRSRRQHDGGLHHGQFPARAAGGADAARRHRR